MWPRPRAHRPGSSGSTVLIAPSRFTRTCRAALSAPSDGLSGSGPAEVPALATNRSTGWSRSKPVSHEAIAGASATSIAAIRTLAPLASQASALAASRSPIAPQQAQLRLRPGISLGQSGAEPARSPGNDYDAKL